MDGRMRWSRLENLFEESSKSQDYDPAQVKYSRHRAVQQCYQQSAVRVLQCAGQAWQGYWAAVVVIQQRDSGMWEVTGGRMQSIALLVALEMRGARWCQFTAHLT